MSINISTEARNAAGSAITNLLDVGSANPNGYIEIRVGPKPTNPQAAATGLLLATLNFSNPAFGAYANGMATANSISAHIGIDEDGIAGWFRCYNCDGVAVLDGDITTIGGGGDIEFDHVDFIKGGTVLMTILLANMPQ